MSKESPEDEIEMPDACLFSLHAEEGYQLSVWSTSDELVHVLRVELSLPVERVEEYQCKLVEEGMDRVSTLLCVLSVERETPAGDDDSESEGALELLFRRRASHQLVSRILHHIESE